MARQTSAQRAISGGVYVILVTGLVAAVRLARNAETTADYGFVCAILFGALASAILLKCFVAKHGDEIGEARFDTSQSTVRRSRRNGS